MSIDLVCDKLWSENYFAVILARCDTEVTGASLQICQSANEAYAENMP